MLKSFLSASLLALSLAACSHSGAPLSVLAPPPEVKVVDAGTDASDAGTVSDAGTNKTSLMNTFKDTSYEITVPSSFVKKDSSALFFLVDPTFNMTMDLDSVVWPDSLDDLTMNTIMALVVNGATLPISEKTKWAGFDAVKMSYTLKASRGTQNSFVWVTLANGRGYSFTCSSFDKKGGEVVIAETVCNTAANSMKLFPLPAPTSK